MPKSREKGLSLICEKSVAYNVDMLSSIEVTKCLLSKTKKVI